MKSIYVLLLCMTNTLLHAQSVGDFRSSPSGGLWSNLSSWQQFNGFFWGPANTIPNTASRLISISSVIVVTNPVHADQITVRPGGKLIIQADF